MRARFAFDDRFTNNYKFNLKLFVIVINVDFETFWRAAWFDNT